MQDFRVKTFLTVCKTLNYTRAAEELALTQPAVSQHITYLEREYGAKLFTYHKKKLELTRAGRVLRDALATMAHDDALLHERIAEVAHGAAVQLRIGMTLTAGEYLVAAPLVRYLAAHPEIRATVRSGGTQQLLSLLAQGAIDCAFVEGLFDKSAFAGDTFRTEQLVCICAADHVFASEPTSVQDLLGERLILREEGSGSRDVLAHALAKHNLSPAAFADTCVVESLDIIKIFVAGDLGISFVYESAVQREVQEGSLRVIPLSGEPITHDIAFVRLPHSIFEDDLRALFEGLQAA
ncbi:LysR family transcriptional regulator [uncultured Adlercreutzia sp.]|uniref:LysR family transcriptional regulator n=1 Tax=uncultured Adlercreutzia sp. TaxID=875803 RepID=UPI0026758B8E|nr:LysR family transcriptional regulator [uncultured Adlercreutzia sp.]